MHPSGERPKGALPLRSRERASEAPGTPAPVQSEFLNLKMNPEVKSRVKGCRAGDTVNEGGRAVLRA